MKMLISIIHVTEDLFLTSSFVCCRTKYRLRTRLASRIATKEVHQCCEGYAQVGDTCTGMLHCGTFHISNKKSRDVTSNKVTFLTANCAI